MGRRIKNSFIDRETADLLLSSKKLKVMTRSNLLLRLKLITFKFKAENPETRDLMEWDQTLFLGRSVVEHGACAMGIQLFKDPAQNRTVITFFGDELYSLVDNLEAVKIVIEEGNFSHRYSQFKKAYIEIIRLSRSLKLIE